MSNEQNPNVVNLQYWPTTRNLRAKVIDATGAQVADFTVSSGSPEAFELQEGQTLQISLLPQTDEELAAQAGDGSPAAADAGTTGASDTGSTEGTATEAATEGAGAAA